MNRRAILGMFVVVLGIASCLFAQETSTNDKPANISGTWHISWQGRGGNREGTLEIQQDGSKLKGTFGMAGRSAPLSGTVQGNKVSFIARGRKRSFSFTGTIDGNQMSGTTQQGTSWSARNE